MATGDGLGVDGRDHRCQVLVGKQALQRSGHQDGGISRSGLAGRGERQALRHFPAELGEHAAHHLAGGHVRADSVHDLGRDGRHVERGGNDAALKAGGDVIGDLHARAPLRLVGVGAQMGRQNSVGELVQRALRAGLVLEHVDARGADLAGGKEVGQRVDVVDAAARHVD